MRLYVWRSEALKLYMRGTLVGVGDGADEAREMLIAGWPEFAKDAWAYMYPETYGGTPTESDIEDRKDKYAMFLKDLEAEPEEHDVLFIWGSE